MRSFSTEFDTLLQKACKGKTHLQLTIGTYQDGKTEFYTMDANGNPLESHLLHYDVGSITKTVTASMLAKQIEEGKLSLDTSLNEIVDGLPSQYYPNLRRLATHVSGYGGLPHTTLQAMRLLAKMHKPDGLLNVNPYYDCVNETAMRKILTEHPMQDKDYSYKYSNFAYGTLGYIVGKAMGSDYWTATNAYLQNELGLKNTWLGPEGSIVGYSSKNVACRNWQWKTTDLIAAAGAISSNAEDILHYTVMHATNEKPYFALTHQKHGNGDKKCNLGLGWRLERSSPYIWHDGSAGVFSCFAGYDAQRKNACVILTNYGFLKTPPLGLALLDALK